MLFEALKTGFVENKGRAKKNGQVLNKPQIRLFLNWSIAAQDL